MAGSDATCYVILCNELYQFGPEIKRASSKMGYRGHTAEIFTK